jgi:CP family cyanate transporter-like MFS transporter
MGGVWVVVWATFLGFSSALVFVLVLALPPLLAPERDVHRLSAGIFTLTYCCPFLGSLLGGSVWDLTHDPITAFSPVVLGGILMAILVRKLDLSSHASDAQRTS